MKDPNRKIMITDVSKYDGVILESKFGDKSDPAFNKPLNHKS